MKTLILSASTLLAFAASASVPASAMETVAQVIQNANYYCSGRVNAAGKVVSRGGELNGFAISTKTKQAYLVLQDSGQVVPLKIEKFSLMRSSFSIEAFAGTANQKLEVKLSYDDRQEGTLLVDAVHTNSRGTQPT